MKYLLWLLILAMVACGSAPTEPGPGLGTAPEYGQALIPDPIAAPLQGSGGAQSQAPRTDIAPASGGAAQEIPDGGRVRDPVAPPIIQNVWPDGGHSTQVNGTGGGPSAPPPTITEPNPCGPTSPITGDPNPDIPTPVTYGGTAPQGDYFPYAAYNGNRDCCWVPTCPGVGCMSYTNGRKYTCHAAP